MTSTTMHTNRPTKPTLLSINHDGPVRVCQQGKGHDGIDWVVEAENHENVIAMINRYGGPNMYDITPISKEA